MYVRLTRKGVAFFVAIAALATAGGVAYATIPSAAGVINGCYKTQNGQLRVVDSGTECSSGETAIQWNRTGPAGAAGPTGATGPQGPKGDTGAPGTKGTNGTNGTNGSDGKDGAPGAKGDPCLPADLACIGPKGDSGTNGADGKDGKDGKDGVNGTNGAPGAPCLPTNPACVGPPGPSGDPAATAFMGLFGTNTNGAQAANGADCTIGEIRLTAALNYTAGGVPANGQLLPINQNIALFSLIGTAYGGNGQTTFQLPDLRGLAPNQMTYSICIDGIFPNHS